MICGGESGPKARPFNIQWAQNIVQQCREAGVACFVKQLGARPQHEVLPELVPFQEGGDPLEATLEPLELEDPKGGDWSEWPEKLRVRQFPGEGR